MNQYEFTYEIPDDITNQVIRFLQMNGEDALAKALISCRIEYEDLGLAYYAVGNCETPIQGTENGGNCLKN